MPEEEGSHERRNNRIRSAATWIYNRLKNRNQGTKMATAIKAIVATSVAGGLAVGSIGYAQALDAKKELASLQNQVRDVEKQQGPAGQNGADGLQGATGAAGPLGPQGPTGIDGQTGSAGRDGVDGKNGVDGKDGVAGKDGIDGKNGLDGINGIPGINGIDGLDGAVGPQGPAGPQGPMGGPCVPPEEYWEENPCQGPPGPQGPAGETGPQGPAGTPSFITKTVFPDQAIPDNVGIFDDPATGSIDLQPGMYTVKYGISAPQTYGIRLKLSDGRFFDKGCTAAGVIFNEVGFTISAETTVSLFVDSCGPNVPHTVTNPFIIVTEI